MLDEYTGAFARYLRTGTVGALSSFCPEGADLARLRVYRNGFLKACIDALRANYPSVEQVTGEERFAVLARPYVEANPPGTAGLVEYGEGFPQHVRATRNAHGLDWLASFAALDRAWTEVYFAEDDRIEVDTGQNPGIQRCIHAQSGGVEPPLSRGERGEHQRSGHPTSDLLRTKRRPTVKQDDQSLEVEPSGRDSGTFRGSGVPSDDAEVILNLRGRLSPRVRLVSLDHCVLDAWRRLREGEPGPRVEIRHAPQQVLVWRNGAEMLYRDLAVPEHAFIAGVAAGRTCAEAAGTALDLDAEFDLVATFASLLHHRILSFAHRRAAGRNRSAARLRAETAHAGVPAPSPVRRVSES